MNPIKELLNRRRTRVMVNIEHDRLHRWVGEVESLIIQAESDPEEKVRALARRTAASLVQNILQDLVSESDDTKIIKSFRIVCTAGLKKTTG